MHKRRGLQAFLLLFGLLGVAGATGDDDLVPVWKRSDGEARVKLSTPKALPQGLVSVSYQLVAVNTALAAPEMVIAQFGVLCRPKTAEPVQLTHSHTTMYRLVAGTMVRASDEPVSPPLEVSLESNHDFASKPAVVACTRALAMLKPG